MQRITIRSTTVPAILLLAAGCAKKTPEPKVASSAGSPAYALAYPGEMSGELSRYTAHSVEVKDSGTRFSTYPDALAEPDWQVVAEVYRAADEAGRGQAFADEMAVNRAVNRFFDAERDDLVRRTSNAVSNAEEKAGCDCDPETHGAVAFAIKDGVGKRLEKRRLETGAAADLIDEHEKALGKKNAKTLSEQAAAVSLAAHYAFVELPTIYQELDRMRDETKRVRKTLAAELADENATLSDPEASKADKKGAEKRIAALHETLSTIDIFEGEAGRLMKRGIEEIPELQKTYEAAFDALMDAVEARAEP